MSGLFIASRFIPYDGSRRAIVVGAVIGPLWMGTKGPLAETDALIDALLEGRRQPRGHFLRLYRERRAGIAAVAEAGHRAWDLHKTAIEADGRTCAAEGET